MNKWEVQKKDRIYKEEPNRYSGAGQHNEWNEKCDTYHL